MTTKIQTDIKAELRTILLRHEGRERAITGKELALILGQRDDRGIRLVIRELITAGLPVASATEFPAGYFIASSWEEARQYEQTIKSRLVEDAYRRRDFKRSAALHLKPARQGRLL